MASGAGDISPAGAEASLEGLPSALLGKILERLPLSCSAFVALACRALADNVRGEEPLWKRLAARGEGRDALDAPPDLDSVMAAELPAGLPSWRAYVEMLHRQRVFMSVSGEIERSGRLAMAAPKQPRVVKIRVLPRPDSEPPEPSRDLYGLRQVSLSTISWYDRIACAGVTSAGQLMMWHTTVVTGKDTDLPEPTFEAPEMHLTKGRAFPWHTECFPDLHKDMGKVARCYVDKLFTWVITQEGDLYSASHFDFGGSRGNVIFPLIYFERCSEMNRKVKQVVSVTPVVHQYKRHIANVVAALDTDGQIWVWGGLDRLYFMGDMLGARQIHSLFGGLVALDEIDIEELEMEDADVKIADPRRLDIGGLQPGEVVTSLASGNFHFVAVTSAGRVFCWGYNDNNQCCGGDAYSHMERPTLVPLDPDHNVIKAAAGDHHTILLTSAGVVLGFGLNEYGPLWPTARNGCTEKAAAFLVGSRPVVKKPRNLYLHREFPTLGPVVDICAGGYASVVIGASGRFLLLGAHARVHGQISGTQRVPSAAAGLVVATTGRERHFQAVVIVAGPGKAQGCRQGSGPDAAPPAQRGECSDNVAECADIMAGASLEEEPSKGAAAAAALPQHAYSPEMLQNLFGHSGAESVWRPEWWASPCEWCGGAGSLRCTQCQVARYCCREHQKKAWKAHKHECRSMKAAKNGDS